MVLRLKKLQIDDLFLVKQLYFTQIKIMDVQMKQVQNLKNYITLIVLLIINIQIL